MFPTSFRQETGPSPDFAPGLPGCYWSCGDCPGNSEAAAPDMGKFLGFNNPWKIHGKIWEVPLEMRILRCFKGKIPKWRFSGKIMEHHSTKWRKFQQAMFDYQMVMVLMSSKTLRWCIGSIAIYSFFGFL